MRYLLLFCFVNLCLLSPAQVTLPYSINQPNIPQDQDSILVPPFYIDSTSAFTSSGFQVGQTVADFTLYDTTGNPVTLSNVLAQGRPVLLVTVSLSCPVSRHSMIYVLPDLLAMYGSQVNLIITYTIDAHPIAPDLCPYSGTVSVPSQNYSDNILIRQDTLYGGRKERLKEFINMLSVNVPCVIDDTANSYWLNFGPAPNNSYLLRPNGEVYNKYGWFDMSKTQILHDIAQLLVSGIDSQVENPIRIFPVPADELLHIAAGSNLSECEILDPQGRIVKMFPMGGASTDIEIADLAEGTYFFRAYYPDGNMATQRFVVTH